MCHVKLQWHTAESNATAMAHSFIPSGCTGVDLSGTGFVCDAIYLT